MKYFRGLSGILKKTYNFKLTFAKLKSKAFLCRRTIKLDKNIIKRAICSPKHLVEDLIQDKNAIIFWDCMRELKVLVDYWQCNCC